MPWNIQVLYVYYRPSIFKEAGITETPEHKSTVEDIKKCTMDTDGDGKTDVYGFGMRGASGGQEPWGSFIYGEGGSFDDLTSDASVQGMQDFIDLYKNKEMFQSQLRTMDSTRQLLTSSLERQLCSYIISDLLKVW